MTMSKTVQNFAFSIIIASLFVALGAFKPMDAEASVKSKIKDYQTASSTSATSTKSKIKNKTTVNLTCMQTAVDTREEAIVKSFTNFTTDISEALTDRKDALHDAWGITDKSSRNTAVKKAWTDWKTAKKEAHTDLKAARKSAWETFKTTAKSSCKETLPKDEGLEKDAAGSVSL